MNYILERVKTIVLYITLKVTLEVIILRVYDVVQNLKVYLYSQRSKSSIKSSCNSVIITFRVERIYNKDLRMTAVYRIISNIDSDLVVIININRNDYITSLQRSIFSSTLQQRYSYIINIDIYILVIDLLRNISRRELSISLNQYLKCQ